MPPTQNEEPTTNPTQNQPTQQAAPTPKPQTANHALVAAMAVLALCVLALVFYSFINAPKSPDRVPGAAMSDQEEETTDTLTAEERAAFMADVVTQQEVVATSSRPEFLEGAVAPQEDAAMTAEERASAMQF